MKRYTILFAFFLTLFTSQSLYAQLSDYQIKTEFEEQFRTLKNELNASYSIEQIDSLKIEIDSLRLNFEQYDELLSTALYPESFEEHLEELNNEVKVLEHRLLIIENQNEKLDTLMSDLASYESEIELLTDKVASLRNSVSNSESGEKELSELVQNYRSNLEKRDQFILNVIDSILLRFDDLSTNDVSELADGAESGKVSDGENPLEIINSIIDENLKILKGSGEELQTEDYLRMYVVQHRFEEVWNQVGDELTLIYGNGEENEWKASINSKLNNWEASASRNMWESMDIFLENAEVQLAAFDNRESFYKALEKYVRSSTNESEDAWLASGNYDEFQRFNSFWNNKIKKDWSTYVQEADVLSMQQISAIDSEIVNWRDKAKPASYVMPILLILSLLVIIGLLVAITRKDKNRV